jgi:energy coupling factor transporter S component ThiW
MGTGTLLAFPGSMVGALCCGLMYRATKKLIPTYLAEIVGTGLIGGLIAYPVATFIMGKTSAVFGYVIPFFISTIGGTIIAAFFIAVLIKTKALDKMKAMFQTS